MPEHPDDEVSVTGGNDSETRTRGGSPERFGYSWDTFSELLSEYEQQFQRWTVHLEPEDWRGKWFLDVGCGMGRNSYWPMTYGARGGWAIDVDDRSLAAARHTLARFPSVELRHMSAYDIAAEGVFDIAFSVGVIHHLEYPERALAAMAKAVKPGGRVLIWVYGYENNRWILWVLNPLRKALFSRLPIGMVHFLSLFPTAVLRLLLHLRFGRIAYFRLIRGFSFRHLRAIVFDQMLPRIAYYWRREEVLALMKGAGLQDIEIAWVNEVSWSAIGTRPAKADLACTRPSTEC